MYLFQIISNVEKITSGYPYYYFENCERVFLGSTLLSIVKTSFSLFPPYFRDLELGVLEDIFLPCGSRKEREAAAKDTTKEEDEAKAIVAKEETSEKSTTTEGAKKKTS